MLFYRDLIQRIAHTDGVTPEIRDRRTANSKMDEVLAHKEQDAQKAREAEK